MLVNAAYWCLGMENEIPAGGTRVDLVGKFEPTKFEFRDDTYWIDRKMSLDEVRDQTDSKR